MSLDDALDLAVKVLSKTLDMTKLTPDKIEISTLRRDNGKTKARWLNFEFGGLFEKGFWSRICALIFSLSCCNTWS